MDKASPKQEGKKNLMIYKGSTFPIYKIRKFTVMKKKSNSKWADSGKITCKQIKKCKEKLKTHI